MADFRSIPVIDVTRDNFREVWPGMLLAIKFSTFVAIDTELSGIGDRKKLFAKSIDDRYHSMADSAKSRSIISLGLSCFRLTKPAQNGSADTQQANNLNFYTQTYNITVLCSEDYTVEPLSLEFLVRHGFDFNKQYSKGMNYYRGSDKPDDDEGIPSIRGLFSQLLLSKVPVVFHNAFLDLVFLYQSFYANLPTSLPVFLADLSEMFSGGVCDTKYLVEFQVRWPASYLEYVFRKSQKENMSRSSGGSRHVTLEFPSYPKSFTYVEDRHCGLPSSSSVGKPFCLSFAAHGWCHLNQACPESHDIDVITDNDDQLQSAEKRKRKKRRNKKQKISGTSTNEEMDTASEEPGSTGQVDMAASSPSVDGETAASMEEDGTDNVEKSSAPDNTQVSSAKEEMAGTPEVSKVVGGVTLQESRSQMSGHRAGFDAFMTGFTLAAFIARSGRAPDYQANKPVFLRDMGVETFINKVTLSGKDMPLQIAKSNFSRTSKEHSEKMAKITKMASS